HTHTHTHTHMDTKSLISRKRQTSCSILRCNISQGHDSYQSINQSIQFYIALLYIPEVALQSPESSCHSYTVIPVVVSYLSSHSCPAPEAWLPISATLLGQGRLT